MANVLNKQTKEYRKSVDTSKYLDGNWIINPILPNCPAKYWKIVGDTVVEMTEQEKQEVDNSKPIYKSKTQIMDEILKTVIMQNGQINIEVKNRIENALKEKPFFQLYLEGQPNYDLARRDVIDCYQNNKITIEDAYKILKIIPLNGELEEDAIEIYQAFESGI